MSLEMTIHWNKNNWEDIFKNLVIKTLSSKTCSRYTVTVHRKSETPVSWQQVAYLCCKCDEIMFWSWVKNKISTTEAPFNYHGLILFPWIKKHMPSKMLGMNE